jgi:hypothetical protein
MTIALAPISLSPISLSLIALSPGPLSEGTVQRRFTVDRVRDGGYESASAAVRADAAGGARSMAKSIARNNDAG